MPLYALPFKAHLGSMKYIDSSKEKQIRSAIFDQDSFEVELKVSDDTRSETKNMIISRGSTIAQFSDYIMKRFAVVPRRFTAEGIDVNLDILPWADNKTIYSQLISGKGVKAAKIHLLVACMPTVLTDVEPVPVEVIGPPPKRPDLPLLALTDGPRLPSEDYYKDEPQMQMTKQMSPMQLEEYRNLIGKAKAVAADKVKIVYEKKRLKDVAASLRTIFTDFEEWRQMKKVIANESKRDPYAFLRQYDPR